MEEIYQWKALEQWMMGNSGVCYITVRWKEPTKSRTYKAATQAS